MLATSAEFKTALQRAHTVVSRVDVVSGTQVLGTLQINGGSVTVDSKSDVSRHCSFTLADPTNTLVPSDLTSLVAPGHELVPYRGIRLIVPATATAPSTTVDEVYPLGVFGISSTQVGDVPGALAIQVDGYDRARRVQRAGFSTPYVIAAGTNYAAAIKALIKSKITTLVDSDFLFATTASVTPLLIFGVGNGDDPWKFAREMATAIGCELFFNAYGQCVLQTPITGSSQATYTEGVDATLLSVTKAINDEDTWNHTIVIGNTSSATGAPVRAESRDVDTGSPTYYLGTFGDVPRPIYVNPYITTQAQAQLVADLLLVQSIGFGENISFSAIPNAAHEANDTVTVIRALSKINATYAIESFTIPMDAKTAMSVVCKRRRVS